MINILDYIKKNFPEDSHQRIYLVGGAVRDILLGRGSDDFDLVVSLTTGELESLGFRLVQGRSTSAIWHRHDEGIGTIEVTLLPNAEKLVDDLLRRDFTINAMAMTLTGCIIDPQNARSDLEHKRLTPCSRHTFTNDPLRIFRAFRFAADGWCITPECEKLLRELDWNRKLSSIPVERFSREMLKALATSSPDIFFLMMQEYGVGIEYIPELFLMPHVPAGPLVHHAEGDLFTHSIQILQRVAAKSRDPLARFCGFFHDIGKLTTDPSCYPRHFGHEQAGFETSDEFCQRIRLPTRYGKALAWVSKLHGTFNLWDQLRDSTRIRLAEQALKVGIEDILPLVAVADKAGASEPAEWKEALHIADMSSTELGIDLQSLESVQQSKRTDYILQKRVERFRAILTTSI